MFEPERYCTSLDQSHLNSNQDATRTPPNNIFYTHPLTEGPVNIHSMHQQRSPELIMAEQGWKE